jgi:hypothetical protein
LAVGTVGIGRENRAGGREEEVPYLLAKFNNAFGSKATAGFNYTN